MARVKTPKQMRRSIRSMKKRLSKLKRRLSKHTHSRKSRKSRRLSKFKKNPNNPCSMRSAKTCGGDPNCHYVKRRGCARRSGVKKGTVVYEGPKLPF
jgi:hypothetical protein